MGNRGLWEPCFERRLLLRYSSLGSSRLNFSTYNLDVEYKILGRSSRFGIGESSLSFVSPGQEVDRDELTRVSVECNWEAGTVRYCLDETMVDEVEKRLIGIFGTEFDEALENVYLARIDVANCQRYLGNLEWLVEDPDDVQLGPWWQGWRDVAGIGGGDWSDSWHYNLSDSTKPYLGEVPEGTVAAALVHNLLFEEGEQRLDHLLAAEVRRLTTQAREGVQQAEDDFRARDAALRQRWRDGTFVDESGG